MFTSGLLELACRAVCVGSSAPWAISSGRAVTRCVACVETIEVPIGEGIVATFALRRFVAVQEPRLQFCFYAETP